MRDLSTLIAALFGAILLTFTGCVDPGPDGTSPADDDDTPCTEDCNDEFGTAEFAFSARDPEGNDMGNGMTLLQGPAHDLEVSETTLRSVDGIAQHVFAIDRDGVPVQVHIYAEPCAPRRMFVCATESTQFYSYTEMGNDCEGGTPSDDGVIDEALDHNLGQVCGDPMEIYDTQCNANRGAIWEVSMNGGQPEEIHLFDGGYIHGAGTGFVGWDTTLLVNGYTVTTQAHDSFDVEIDPTTDCFSGTIDGFYTIEACRQQ